jgi:hypothetical protein
MAAPTAGHPWQHQFVRIRIALLSLLASACGDGTDGGFTRVPSRGYFQPEAVDFGERPLGQTSQADVTLTNASAEILLFESVTFEGADGSAFAARTGAGDTLRGAQLSPSATLPLSILFGPSEERAYAAKMVVVSKELAIELDVSGRGKLIPPATPGFSPTAISFGQNIEIGRMVSEPLRVTNVGDVPGRLARIDARSPFSVTLPGGAPATPSLLLMPGDGVDLEVRFAPVVEGPASAALLFEMDGGGAASLPANGGAIPASVLACDRSTADFGAVLRGQTSSLPVICQADGPFTVAAIEIPAGGASFQVEDVSPAIGSTSAGWSFDLVFRASGIAGMRAGRIELVGGTGARTIIDAAGEVIAPPPASTDLRISMSWTAAGTDFDLHLVRAGGLPFDAQDDCHFAAKTIDWGNAGDDGDDPFLDRDDVDGPGVEELNLATARDGFYDAWVMYFDDASFSGAADIQIEYNLEGGATQSVAHAMSTCGNMWHVGTFDFRVSPAVFASGGSESDQWATRTDECR